MLKELERVNAKAEANKLERCSNFAEHIGRIKKLPDPFINPDGTVTLVDSFFLPGSKFPNPFLISPDQKKLLAAVRKQYRATAEWLEYYLLDKTDLLPELTTTDKVNFKPFAEVSLAKLKLIQELYSRVPAINEVFDSPGQVWLESEYSSCWGWLHTTFIGNLPISPDPEQSIKGKGDMRNFTRKAIEHYRDGKCDPSRLGRGAAINNFYLRYFPSTLEDYLRLFFWGQLHEIASALSQDKDFDTDHWLPYWRAQRRFYNRVKNTSSLQFLYIDGAGKLHTTEKGKQQSDSRSRRFRKEI